jgi:hypothetical protein
MRKLVAAALLAAFGLSGCIVVPAYERGYSYSYGPGYYDPGYTYYGSGYARRGYRSY